MLSVECAAGLSAILMTALVLAEKRGRAQPTTRARLWKRGGAEPTPRARLELAREAGAERCLDEGEVRAQVALRLDYHPFAERAPRMVPAAVELRLARLPALGVDLAPATRATLAAVDPPVFPTPPVAGVFHLAFLGYFR